MTGEELKQFLLEAMTAALSGMLPLQEMESVNKEALLVLQETLPQMDARILQKEVMQYEEPYSEKQIEDQCIQIQKATSDETVTKAMSLFLDMCVSNLNSSTLLDLSPSLHYQD